MKQAAIEDRDLHVNGVNGRLEVLLGWLAEASPDVVCLQELKAPQEKFPMKAIEEAGYGAVWQGQKSWNGVALLAKDQEPTPEAERTFRAIRTTFTADTSRRSSKESSSAA
nr:endonuclease/exonuclease/phosphatase family protein [Rhizobium sp. 007]